MTSEHVDAAGYGAPPGGYGGPPGGAPPGGYGGGRGYGPPPGGGYGGPPGGAPPGYGGPPPGGYGGPPPYGVPPAGYGPPGFGPPPGGGPKVHPLAIAALVCGVLALPACCCSFAGAPVPVAAIVCGLLGMSKIKASPQMFSGNGLCLAGIIMGGIALLLDVAALFTTIDDQLRSNYGHF